MKYDDLYKFLSHYCKHLIDYIGKEFKVHILSRIHNISCEIVFNRITTKYIRSHQYFLIFNGLIVFTLGISFFGDLLWFRLGKVQCLGYKISSICI